MAQRSWRCFTSLAQAWAGTRGCTFAALQLVGQNLLVDETVTWVAAARVNGVMSWEDGVVVLSDQHFFVSQSNKYTSLMSHLPIASPTAVQELQFQGWGRRFRVNGMPVQAVQLQTPEFEYLKAALRTRMPDDVHATQALRDIQPKKGDVLRLLARLHEAGVLSETDFRSKKAEVLGDCDAS